MANQNPHDLEQRLRKHGQEHLLQFADRISPGEFASLAAQIAALDFDLIFGTAASETGSLGDNRPSRAERATAPKQVIHQPQSDADLELRVAAAATGSRLFADGHVAVMTVAGGQGTRLGFDQSKGMFPIGPCSDRTLFQIFAEQILARRRRYGGAIPWYIMTSTATHSETNDFFARHDYFGLDQETVFFFQQGSLPAVSVETGCILMDSPSTLSLAPDGHGGMVAALQHSGCLQEMVQQGIEHVFYHQVDNPTVIMCDPILLGLHASHDSQLTTIVVRKTDPSEPMGTLVNMASQTEIIEYSELTAEQAAACDSDGTWIFWAGNTAIHVFRRDFLEYLMEDGNRLPLHPARKTMSHIDDMGNRVKPAKPNAIKFERFIFDALPLAERTLIVEGRREREFNPVKNADGQDSPATARAALSNIGREWLEGAGQMVPDGATVEISPLIALDAEELAALLTQGDVRVADLICEASEI